MSYTPPEEILEKYADLIINFSLNKGKPIEKGDVVLIEALDYASPFVNHLANRIKKDGAEFLLQYYPAHLRASLIDTKISKELQITLKETFKHKINIANKYINIRSMEDELIDPNDSVDYKIRKYQIKLIRDKTKLNKLNKSLCLYPNDYMSQLANTDLKTIWSQIRKACFLDETDPIYKNKKIYKQINKIKKYLNSLNIDSVYIKGDDVDLRIKIGGNRRWIGATYRNTPSFEIYTSPDYRSSNGWIKFNTPKHLDKNTITDVYFEFKKGELVELNARRNQKNLNDFFSKKNTRRIGEISFTDRRISSIDKVLNCSLYDENFGGKHGNMHIGMGSSYPITIDKHKDLTSQQMQEEGLNTDCYFHTDFVLRSPFTVEATLINGEKVQIYKNGKYNIKI